ncbi:MAG: hypothetical protein H0W70_01970 [Actinobacteria bacterium]|nr:hypothetical protein [Actinomycetota bacterium]
MTPARLLAGALIAGVVVTTTAAAAGAAQPRTPDCEVRVGGHRFRNGGHVAVPANRRATVSVTALEEKPRYRVRLELAGVTSTVGTGRGQEFGWRRQLDVPHYADFGVGTYRLHVITAVDGKPCVVTGLVDITRRAPVTTLAGGAAALAFVIAAITLVVALFRRGGRPLRTRHAVGVDDPLGRFAAVDTPGNYVGWAEVACDLGARTFVTVKPSGEAVRAFMREPKTHVALAGMQARGVRIRAGDDSTVLPRLRWRPRFFVLTPLLAAAGGIALAVYLQQAAVLYLTPVVAALGALGGVVAGVVVANLARLLGTVALNRRLKAAEGGLDVETVEPRYPPIDHLDKLDTFVWTPTHTIPREGDGQPAWSDADRTQAPAATLDPGLAVRVVERKDGLAQVVCSNGWVGWTDADKLHDIDG